MLQGLAPAWYRGRAQTLADGPSKKHLSKALFWHPLHKKKKFQKLLFFDLKSLVLLPTPSSPRPIFSAEPSPTPRHCLLSGSLSLVPVFSAT